MLTGSDSEDAPVTGRRVVATGPDASSYSVSPAGGLSTAQAAHSLAEASGSCDQIERKVNARCGDRSLMHLAIGTVATFAVCAVTMLAFANTSICSSEFENLLQSTRWIAYAPTNFNPDVIPPVLPSEGSLRADMLALRSAGFDGLITYGAQFPSVVTVAEQAGFRAVLLGIWDPASEEELGLAKESAANSIVVGIIVGNEGLLFRRYEPETLYLAMAEVRRDTGKPVSTTEVVEYFYTRKDLVDWSDFLTVNAHPYLHGHRDPVRAVDWTLGTWDRLKRHVPNKPILFKEVGLPTGGAPGNSERHQSEYYHLLITTTEVQFAFFEGFDALFKLGAVEKSWGLFRSDRSPKPAVSILIEDNSCSGPLQRTWCQSGVPSGVGGL